MLRTEFRVHQPLQRRPDTRIHGALAEWWSAGAITFLGGTLLSVLAWFTSSTTEVTLAVLATGVTGSVGLLVALASAAQGYAAREAARQTEREIQEIGAQIALSSGPRAQAILHGAQRAGTGPLRDFVDVILATAERQMTLLADGTVTVEDHVQYLAWLCARMARADRGDQILAVSSQGSQSWAQSSNRDYLAANQTAIRNGAVITRVFIRSPEDDEKRWIELLSSHHAVGVRVFIAQATWTRERLLSESTGFGFVVFRDTVLLDHEGDPSCGTITVNSDRISEFRRLAELVFLGAEPFTAPVSRAGPRGRL